jgi:NADH:ubiquinone oxidoreductase subunit F (NADH-binding)/(2Fe-2S) ferredoxin
MTQTKVLVSGDPLSMSRKAEQTKLAFETELTKHGLEDSVEVGYTGKINRTDLLPAVIVYPDAAVYGPVTSEDVPVIVEEHLNKGQVVDYMLAPDEVTADIVESIGEVGEPLFAQKRVVLKRAGMIDPYSLEDYIASGGYSALAKALDEMTPSQVVQEVRASNLQGRGGAGFPTGLKWSFVAQRPEEIKYVVCNADESEPGTFKDRLILEGDPHTALEGMALTGYAVGAHEGWIYIRGEYAMAAKILRHAIEQAETENLLGDNILGSDFSFHIHVHSGAGAYVCGEETALLESLEGKRGIPRIRPPYPTVKGFRDLPTVVNNVETIANVPSIVLNGADWYHTIGTERNPGTKVYMVMGDVEHKGIVEAPMGTTLREIIDIYSGGMKDGKAFKCAQTGGSSGSIIPSDFLDVPMDFATMREEGAGLGSGALLICDEDTDVVDLAYVLVRFFKTESCGKCTPCRVGNTQMLEALDRLCKGTAQQADLDRLGEIARYVQQASFCGLGQAAPVPVLTGLKYFYDEFQARVKN